MRKSVYCLYVTLVNAFLSVTGSWAAVVESSPGYNAWPMIQAIDGRLICTYSRGSGHSIGEGLRDAFCRVSSDGGCTWGAETVVSANPEEGEVMIGKGVDSTGAALFWVRCLGRAKHHDLYRTTDGKTFVKIASPKLDPFPMQITDVFKVGKGLMCLWFATNYTKEGRSSWGTLLSTDDGRSWIQRVIENNLPLSELPTEPSVCALGGGRLLGVARTEISGDKGGAQFQLTSVDDGETWRKAKTNITDIRISTPSLVYDETTDTVSNYYYERGKGKVKRRTARAGFVFDHADAWPEPDVVAYGHEERPYDAGNVNVTVQGTTHYLAYYYGTHSDAAVYAEGVKPNLLLEEDLSIAVFGGSFSVMKTSDVAKDVWRRELGCRVVNFGMGGMGFLRGADRTNDIPNQIRKALARGERYQAYVLWASTNDIGEYSVEQQNESISNCVQLIRTGAPEAKILFFASMPWPLNPEKDAVLSRFVEGQLKTCESLGVPCLDLYHESGITAENAQTYTASDRHHPNAAGYARIAPLQVAFLRRHLAPMTWSYRYDDSSPARLDVNGLIVRAAEHGGRAVVPKGTWLCAPIELKSNVELVLEAGAELVFTDEVEKYLPSVRTSYEGIECYNYRPPIYAYGATNIAIVGKGVLRSQMGRWETWRWNGQGTQFAKKVLTDEWGAKEAPIEERDLTKLPEAKTRPQFIGLNACSGVRLEGFALCDSPFWCIHLLDCESVELRGLSVRSFLNNSDGVDVECSRNVLIEDCSFDQGDDVVVLKSGKDRDGRRRAKPTENVLVRHCRAGSGHGFLVVGSECSGGIRNVTMEDCIVDGSLATLFKVKTTPKRGGFVKNITMRRVKARTIIDSVLEITMNYAINPSADGAEDVLTEIEGLKLEDIHVETAGRRILATGDERRPVRRVEVRNLAVDRCAKADVIHHVEVTFDRYGNSKRGDGGCCD